MPIPSTLARDWDSPGFSCTAITPNDGADLPGGECRWIWVGGAGNIALIAKDDSSSVTFIGVPVGPFKVAAKRVLSTGTTATNMIAIR